MKAIAIGGWGINCPEKNLILANETGSLLASYCYIVCVGGLTGTFHEALKGAKDKGGQTKAFIDAKPDNLSNTYCDEIEIIEDQSTKHIRIARYCDAIILIGGGEGSLKLIDRFLFLNKPVIVINETGGIADSIISNNITYADTIKEAVDIINKN
ncbi:MAG: hypothetical protein WCL51_02455 [Bacteroidota bacterium]